jgi:hypothetical protein
MSRLAILLATIGLGLTLLSGSGSGLGRPPVGVTNWASQVQAAAPTKAPPAAPQNWASPRQPGGSTR